MRLELPLFASIPKTGPNPPIIFDYMEQFMEENDDTFHETNEMIEYMRERLIELTRVPRRFFNNGRE